MGRPRGFDEDAALEATMRVFWEKSYEGATIADLTEAMGINRSSMYAAFDDKESVIHRAMERYREGELPAEIQPTDFARYISSVMAGLGIQADNGVTRIELRRVASLALRCIETGLSGAVSR